MNIKGAVVLAICVAAAIATVWGSGDGDLSSLQQEPCGQGFSMWSLCEEAGTGRGYLQVASPSSKEALGVRSSFRRVLGAPDARRYGLSAHGFVVLVGRASGQERVEAVGEGVAQVPVDSQVEDHLTSELGHSPRRDEVRVDACPACEGGVDEIPKPATDGEGVALPTPADLWRITFYAQSGDPYCPYPCDTTACPHGEASEVFELDTEGYGLAACGPSWPCGSRFKIDGDKVHPAGVICYDRGSAVTNRQLDIFFYQADGPQGGWAWLAEVGSWAEVTVLE